MTHAATLASTDAYAPAQADASLRAKELRVPALDGLQLAATLAEPAGAPRAAVIVNSAMAVRREHYAPFARAAAQRGFATVTYDYRGIGGST